MDNTIEEICSGINVSAFPSISHSITAAPFLPSTTLNGSVATSSFISENLRPISLFAENIVLAGFVTACLLADWPTSLSPSFPNATIEGVVRFPSEFGITLGSPASITAMHELLVPKSIPIILLTPEVLQLTCLHE